VRFRKRLTFGPVNVNLSGKGVGASIGVPGARVGVNARGQKYVATGLPGTGLSQQHSVGTGSTSSGAAVLNRVSLPSNRFLRVLSWLYAAVAVFCSGSVLFTVKEDALFGAIALSVFFLIVWVFAYLVVSLVRRNYHGESLATNKNEIATIMGGAAIGIWAAKKLLKSR
jgi:hypothetical protein